MIFECAEDREDQLFAESQKIPVVRRMKLDDEGLPTSARDYTRGIFKGGHDPASLYRRIADGMPGTPMPATSQATPEQMIDLVHFLRSLSDESTRQAAILNRETIVAKAAEAIADATASETWSAVAPVALRMTPLWWRNDSDPDLQVQAVHDGKTIALRLSWRDEIADQDAARSESFEDAVAVEVYRGRAEPFVGMGDPQSPVDAWFWDADRQSPPAVEDVYPNVVVDIYPFNESFVDTALFDRPGTRDTAQADVSLPARASGNSIVPTGESAGASSLTVGGPGSVTFRIPKSQLVTAGGQWADGRWTVVMTRSLRVDPDQGVSLEPGDKASIAFAIWDGAQRDRDGKKLIAIWQDLVVE